jgi:dTDP-4-amino-4,6-dideoxygalactose transaminase
MVVTDSKPVSSRVRHLTTQARSEAFEYNHDDIGYNYRLTNVLAAMGVAQMEQLDGFINIKRLNATLYRSLLSGINNVEFLWESPWARSNFWFYTLKVPAKSKNSLMSFLLDKSIQVRPVWKPMTSLPMYKKSQSYHIENAVTIYNTCINLPCSVDLRKDEIMRVADSIKMYFGKRGRA